MAAAARRLPCLSYAGFVANMALTGCAKAMVADRKIVVDRRQDASAAHYRIQVRGAPGCLLAFAVMALWLALLTALALLGIVALTLAISIAAGAVIVLLIAGFVRAVLRR